MKFEDLKAWQKARELANAVYDMVRGSELAKDFGLRDQIQRAAVSVMNNVAEGFGRKHKAEKIQLYNVARASAGEVRSMSYLIADQKLASPERIEMVHSLSLECSALIQGLVRSTEN
jgi:four helix bundle protein